MDLYWDRSVGWVGFCDHTEWLLFLFSLLVCHAWFTHRKLICLPFMFATGACMSIWTLCPLQFDVSSVHAAHLLNGRWPCFHLPDDILVSPDYRLCVLTDPVLQVPTHVAEYVSKLSFIFFLLFDTSQCFAKVFTPPKRTGLPQSLSHKIQNIFFKIASI